MNTGVTAAIQGRTDSVRLASISAATVASEIEDVFLEAL
jgi:hypothetical protein